MDNKFPSFSYVVKRDTTVAGFATSTLATSTRTREGEFLESIKGQRLQVRPPAGKSVL
jgi:hypothetical protein